ncbi:MAG: hypothetical protein M3P85_10760 [Actinomycetota bacterium]|jgi:hypothetical protein|nr:hypothetical protein [Actinomycetota bacterium]
MVALVQLVVGAALVLPMVRAGDGERSGPGRAAAILPADVPGGADALAEAAAAPSPDVVPQPERSTAREGSRSDRRVTCADQRRRGAGEHSRRDVLLP